MTDSPSRELGLSLIGLSVTFTLFLLLGALLSWLAGRARLVLSLAAGLAVFLGAAFLADRSRCLFPRCPRETRV